MAGVSTFLHSEKLGVYIAKTSIIIIMNIQMSLFNSLVHIIIIARQQGKEAKVCKHVNWVSVGIPPYNRVQYQGGSKGLYID